MNNSSPFELCIAVYLIIIVLTVLYVSTNEKAKARTKFLWKDKQYRNIMYFLLAGVLISIIPVFGQIVGILMMIAAAIGGFIRARQINAFFDRYYKDLDQDKKE